MNIRPARPVHVFPETEILHWSIFEAVIEYKKNCYLMGQNIRSGNGRISSAIQAIDVDLRIVRTASGREYALVGPSGSHASARAVFDAWCIANGVKGVRDVTSEYFSNETGCSEI
jgi:hypothetical protein